MFALRSVETVAPTRNRDGYRWTSLRGHLVARCGSLEPVTEVRILPPQLQKARQTAHLLAATRWVEFCARSGADAVAELRWSRRAYAAACVAPSRYSSK